MPTAVFDASLITFRKRAGVLAAFKSNLDLMNTTNNVVKREQPTFQSGEVITQQGARGLAYVQKIMRILLSIARHLVHADAQDKGGIKNILESYLLMRMRF